MAAKSNNLTMYKIALVTTTAMITAIIVNNKSPTLSAMILIATIAPTTMIVNKKLGLTVMKKVATIAQVITV